MRSLSSVVWICSTTALLCLAVTAQEPSKISCPDSVSVSDPQLAQPITGWRAMVDKAPHRLSRVAFFDGPVEQNASLAPNKETQAGKIHTATWLLQPTAERTYWLACYYSRTSLMMTRALPPGLKECTVTYDRSVEIDGMPSIKSLSCK